MWLLTSLHLKARLHFASGFTGATQTLSAPLLEDVSTSGAPGETGCTRVDGSMGDILPSEGVPFCLVPDLRDEREVLCALASSDAWAAASEWESLCTLGSALTEFRDVGVSERKAQRKRLM